MAMKRTLAVDRSGPAGSWALFADEALVALSTFGEAPPRSPDWLPAMLAGLAGHGLGPGDVSEYVVGTGPGSFSGIRAAIAALQGLALPGGAPVLGVPSAAALACADFRRHGNPLVAVAGDARRGRLWLAAFDFSPAGAETVAAPPALTTREALPSLLPPGARLLSPERARLARALEEAAAKAGASLAEGDGPPTAEDVARLRFAYPGAAVRDPIPVYLHPAVG